MPLPILLSTVIPRLSSLAIPYFPFIALVLLYSIHKLSQGRRTPFDRDLRNRTVLLTGLFESTLSFRVLEELAKRGACVIALVHPKYMELADVVEAVRDETKNREIYLESLDLSRARDIRAFVAQLLKTLEEGANSKGHGRIDVVLYMHESKSVGRLWQRETFAMKKRDEGERDNKSLATFYLTTLLLPYLLTADAERDIRIVNVVNSFYAAALKPLSSTTAKTSSGVIHQEGRRSRRMIVFSRHLQRVLNALPSAPKVQTPAPSESVTSPPTSEGTSNISSITVSPALSRSESISPLLSTFMNIILYPLLLLFTRTVSSSSTSVLHALFVPSPLKLLSAGVDLKKVDEILVPGALYADCRVVGVKFQVDDDKPNEREKLVEGDIGDDEGGRTAWEWMEEGVKNWVKREEENSEPTEHK